jgi:hypothetical protein
MVRLQPVRPAKSARSRVAPDSQRSPWELPAFDVVETEAPETSTSHHKYNTNKPFLQRNGLFFHVTGYAETGSGSN